MKNIYIIIGIGILGLLFFLFFTPHISIETGKPSFDSQRKINISNIAAALQTYFDNHGEYPKSDNTGDCLSKTNETSIKLMVFFKDNKIPLDPEENKNTFLCPIKKSFFKKEYGVYWYKSVNNNSNYILCANFNAHRGGNINLLNVKNLTLSQIRKIIKTEQYLDNVPPNIIGYCVTDYYEE